MRLAGLPADSAFSDALFPTDPETGKRSRRPAITVIDDADAVDAFFSRQGD